MECNSDFYKGHVGRDFNDFIYLLINSKGNLPDTAKKRPSHYLILNMETLDDRYKYSTNSLLHIKTHRNF